MDIQAICTTAVVRKWRYLEHFRIAIREDWEMLKLSEEILEAAEAHDRFLDAPGDAAARQGFREELADVLGFLAIVADKVRVPLDAGAPPDPASTPDKAWRVLLRDLGAVSKGYNRMTRQSRLAAPPAGMEDDETERWKADAKNSLEVLSVEMAEAMAAAVASLKAAAAAHGVDLAAAFAEKWGLPGLTAADVAKAAEASAANGWRQEVLPESVEQSIALWPDDARTERAVCVDALTTIARGYRDSGAAIIARNALTAIAALPTDLGGAPKTPPAHLAGDAPASGPARRR